MDVFRDVRRMCFVTCVFAMYDQEFYDAPSRNETSVAGTKLPVVDGDAKLPSRAVKLLSADREAGSGDVKLPLGVTRLGSGQLKQDFDDAKSRVADLKSAVGDAKPKLDAPAVGTGAVKLPAGDVKLGKGDVKSEAPVLPKLAGVKGPKVTPPELVTNFETPRAGTTRTPQTGLLATPGVSDQSEQMFGPDTGSIPALSVSCRHI
jgi:hypothetical protein